MMSEIDFVEMVKFNQETKEALTHEENCRQFFNTKGTVTGRWPARSLFEDAVLADPIYLQSLMLSREYSIYATTPRTISESLTLMSEALGAKLDQHKDTNLVIDSLSELEDRLANSELFDIKYSDIYKSARRTGKSFINNEVMEYVRSLSIKTDPKQRSVPYRLNAICSGIRSVFPLRAEKCSHYFR